MSVWKCNELHLIQSYWIPGHEKSKWLVNSVTCDLIICCFPVFVQMVLLAVFSSGQVTNPLVIIPCHSGKLSEFYCLCSFYCLGLIVADLLIVGKQAAQYEDCYVQWSPRLALILCVVLANWIYSRCFSVRDSKIKTPKNTLLWAILLWYIFSRHAIFHNCLAY